MLVHISFEMLKLCASFEQVLEYLQLQGLNPLPFLAMLRILLGLMSLGPYYRFLVVDAAVIPTATASAFRTIPGRNNLLIGFAAYFNAATTNFASPFLLHPLGLEQSLSCDLQAQSNASSHGALKLTPEAFAGCDLP